MQYNIKLSQVSGYRRRVRSRLKLDFVYLFKLYFIIKFYIHKTHIFIKYYIIKYFVAVRYTTTNDPLYLIITLTTVVNIK